jgi:hypothetical protein
MAPTLIYFGIPARAEVARLLFTLGKLEFEVSHAPASLTQMLLQMRVQDW